MLSQTAVTAGSPNMSPAGDELATLHGTPVDKGVTHVPSSVPNALHSCGDVHTSALQQGKL